MSRRGRRWIVAWWPSGNANAKLIRIQHSPPLLAEPHARWRPDTRRAEFLEMGNGIHQQRLRPIVYQQQARPATDRSIRQAERGIWHNDRDSGPVDGYKVAQRVAPLQRRQHQAPHLHHCPDARGWQGELLARHSNNEEALRGHNYTAIDSTAKL